MGREKKIYQHRQSHDKFTLEKQIKQKTYKKRYRHIPHVLASRPVQHARNASYLAYPRPHPSQPLRLSAENSFALAVTFGFRLGAPVHTRVKCGKKKTKKKSKSRGGWVELGVRGRRRIKSNDGKIESGDTMIAYAKKTPPRSPGTPRRVRVGGGVFDGALCTHAHPCIYGLCEREPRVYHPPPALLAVRARHPLGCAQGARVDSVAIAAPVTSFRVSRRAEQREHVRWREQ